MISESDILKCFQHLVDSSYHKESILIGSGDDAAVIDTQERKLIHSIDISKLGVHFHRDNRPEDIAIRSISTALSDLAGMGSYPAFITIGLTSNIEEISWYERFSDGIKEVLDEFKIDLVGGDVTKGELNICVSVFGYPFDKPILRSGAKVGDSVFISGKLGEARQGLQDWLNKKQSNYLEKYLQPKPQFKKAKQISAFATSCIDISDGLIKDLGNICKQSCVGAELHFENIPIHNDYNDLNYGDDYELCFTAPSKHNNHFIDLGFYLIGEIKKEKSLVVKDQGNILEFNKDGWDPFS